MRFYAILLLIVTLCPSWAQSPPPVPDNPVKEVPTTSAVGTTTTPKTVTGTTQTLDPTPKNEITTSITVESTTDAPENTAKPFNATEFREKMKNMYAETRKIIFDELMKDHELCLTGDERSPVNLNFVNAQPVYLPGIEFVNYDTTGSVSELATDHTAALVGFGEWKNVPFIRGGALQGEYVLWEFYHNNYFSSQTSDVGQVAHSINLACYDYEAHFVHVKRGMTLDQARGVPGAITIVAVEYKRNSSVSANSGLGPEAPFAPDSEWNYYPKEVNGTLKEWIRPQELIPKDTTSFFSYKGSMPQTPCSPGVNWIVLANPVHIIYNIHSRMMLDRRTHSPVVQAAEAATIGNRTVIFNFGEEKDPSRLIGYSIYAVILVALVTIGLTYAIWFAVEKYAKKPIERGYVKYFVNK